MAERDPEYHTTNDDAPGSFNTIDAFLFDLAAQEAVKQAPDRLPQAKLFVSVMVERLPEAQTFATANDFVVFLIRQYCARARRMNAQIDFLELMLLPGAGAEVYHEAASDGRSLAFPRHRVRRMEVL